MCRPTAFRASLGGECRRPLDALGGVATHQQLRIVMEADSFEWHGGRGDLARDAVRYNQLTVHGWIVLRFTWQAVMHDPDYVRRVLTAAVALATAA